MLLEPGLDLTLRPMAYPAFFRMYRDAIKNTWTVEEVDFSRDYNDLRRKMSEGDRHMINRLVHSLPQETLLPTIRLNLQTYQLPEARMYLSRQLFERGPSCSIYLTLLDTYIPDIEEREEAFLYSQYSFHQNES